MRFVLLLSALMLLSGCAHQVYEQGMHRQDVYEELDTLRLSAFLMEAQLDARHDVLVVPQGGFTSVFDGQVLDAERGSFGRFRATETATQRDGRLVRAFAEVELWYALMLRDQRVYAIIEDEDRERLIWQVEGWMQEFVNLEFDRARLSPLQITPMMQ